MPVCVERVVRRVAQAAANGRRPAAGLHLDPEPYDSVRAAVAALLGRHRATAAAPSRRDVLLELHDSQDASLPVYSGASSASPSPEIGSVVVALGCVEDHLDSIAAIVDEGSRLGYDVGRVNLGPLTEFSSKIVHLVQAHHDAGRLLPALAELLRGGGQSAEPAGGTVWREKARAPRKGGGLMGERVASAGAPSTAVCDLHFCESFQRRCSLVFRGCSRDSAPSDGRSGCCQGCGARLGSAPVLLCPARRKTLRAPTPSCRRRRASRAGCWPTPQWSLWANPTAPTTGRRALQPAGSPSSLVSTAACGRLAGV